MIREAGKDWKLWPLNSYSSEGLRLTDWLGAEEVRKYHRNVETYVTALLENGSVLTGLREWCPSKEDAVGLAKSKNIEGHRPNFLLR